MNAVVAVRGLVVHAASGPVLDGVDLVVRPGEAVGVTGPSGAGKSTLAMAVLGHLRPGLRHVAGEVSVDGVPMLPVPAPGVRGRVVGYVGQDPGASLNPFAPVRSILLTALGARVPRRDRDDVVAAMLERVGLPSDREFARRFPRRLSGGQQQRVVLAAALAREPRVLVLDEPTTALDPASAAEVFAELRRVRERGTALLWISHDVAALRESTDRVVTIVAGQDRPVPSDEPVFLTARRAAEPRAPRPVLRVRGLTAGYGPGRTVLDAVDLSLGGGECVAVSGASGAGKSTFARCLAGLHRPEAGTLEVAGRTVAWDVRTRSREERASVQYVAQNPVEALHPAQDVRTALTRPLRVLRGTRSRPELDVRASDLLDAVQLPSSYLDRLPGELSGGQRQRVALARALAAEPAVLVCDEVTASLDDRAAAGVLDLLGGLRASRALAIVLITHDPRAAASIADHEVVLTDGALRAADARAALRSAG